AAVVALIPAPAAVNARLLLAALGVVPAMFVGTYKGVLLSTTAQIVWRRARWLGAKMGVSSAALGAAALLSIATLTDQAPAADGLRVALAVLLAISAPITILELAETWSDLRIALGTSRT